METRRAQCYPDEELLLGTPYEGWKVTRKSVARSVALALGLSLREAWLKNPHDELPPSMKATRSLAVLNNRQKSRKSGIELSYRSQFCETTLIEGPDEYHTHQKCFAVGETRGSLLNAARRTVAPKKGWRSKFVLNSDSSLSEDNFAGIQHSPAAAVFIAARRDEVT
jgi:DNA (cytosine-5)-methyltransferase 1